MRSSTFSKPVANCGQAYWNNSIWTFRWKLDPNRFIIGPIVLKHSQTIIIFFSNKQASSIIIDSKVSIRHISRDFMWCSWQVSALHCSVIWGRFALPSPVRPISGPNAQSTCQTRLGDHVMVLVFFEHDFDTKQQSDHKSRLYMIIYDCCGDYLWLSMIVAVTIYDHLWLSIMIY